MSISMMSMSICMSMSMSMSMSMMSMMLTADMFQAGGEEAEYSCGEFHLGGSCSDSVRSGVTLSQSLHFSSLNFPISYSLPENVPYQEKCRGF